MTSVRRVLLVEGACNATVFCAKLIAGLISGSVAMIADALHSLVDITNNILALFATKLSEAPPDPDHPYGHKKFEWLAVFVLAVLMAVLAVEIVISAVSKPNDPVLFSPLSLALMSGVLLVNLVLSVWQRHWASRLNSELLRADAAHTLSDAGTTAVILAGYYLASHGFYWLDTVLALIVSMLVFYLSYGLFQRSIPILVDETGLDLEYAHEELLRLPGVESVRQIRSRRVGDAVFADVIIGVNPSLDTVQSHSIADTVEQYLQSSMHATDVMVHIEPEH